MDTPICCTDSFVINTGTHPLDIRLARHPIQECPEPSAHINSHPSRQYRDGNATEAPQFVQPIRFRPPLLILRLIHADASCSLALPTTVTVTLRLMLGIRLFIGINPPSELYLGCSLLPTRVRWQPPGTSIHCATEILQTIAGSPFPSHTWIMN